MVRLVTKAMSKALLNMKMRFVTRKVKKLHLKMIQVGKRPSLVVTQL